MNAMDGADAIWPDLAYGAWRETLATLHLWTQIVGKIRLTLTPWLNHGWQAPLYVTARGLGTSPIPIGAETFEIEFDFVGHRLMVRTSRGAERSLPLGPQSVADFYRATIDLLEGMGIAVTIKQMPNEVPNPIRFSHDRIHAAYDAAAAHRFWRALLQADRVFKLFRTGFLGKASSVHFFWGSFDLAVTRFSARRAPLHPGGVPGLPDAVAREAYSHEVSSAGFWPGNEAFPRRLLRLRLSRTGGFSRPGDDVRRRFRCDAWRVHPAVRRGRASAGPGCCRRPMRLQPRPEAGTAPLWNARSAFRDGCAHSRREGTRVLARGMEESRQGWPGTT